MNRRDLTALGLAVTLFAAIRPPLFETPWGGSDRVHERRRAGREVDRDDPPLFARSQPGSLTGASEAVEDLFLPLAVPNSERERR